MINLLEVYKDNDLIYLMPNSIVYFSPLEDGSYLLSLVNGETVICKNDIKEIGRFVRKAYGE